MKWSQNEILNLPETLCKYVHGSGILNVESATQSIAQTTLSNKIRDAAHLKPLPTVL